MTLKLTQITDQELVKLIVSKTDTDMAFKFLVNKFNKKIYWQVRKMLNSHDDADDVTQDIFIKIWQNLPRFRQDAQLSTWIFRIAHNETLNFIAKNKKFVSESFDTLEKVSRNVEGLALSGDEIYDLLQKAVLTLPEKQRAVFNFKYYDEMTYEQIAEITSTSVGALKASYHLAVKKIEAFLNNENLI